MLGVTSVTLATTGAGVVPSLPSSEVYYIAAIVYNTWVIVEKVLSGYSNWALKLTLLVAANYKAEGKYKYQVSEEPKFAYQS